MCLCPGKGRKRKKRKGKMEHSESETGRRKPRKPIWHMIWAVVLIALALMVLGTIVGELLAGVLLTALRITDGATVFLFRYLSFIGIHLVLILYTWLCEKPILRSFGHRGPNGGSGNTWKLLGLGLAAGFVMNAVCILIAWLHGDIDLSPGRFRALYLLAALLCVGVQSGAEELLTRGYMLGAIRDRYNVWVAVVFNSLFFGALHLFNTGVTVLSMVNLVLYGLSMSVAMVKLESLWFCVGVHTAWNFSQSIFFGLPNSGIVSEGSFLKLEAATDSAFYDAVFGVEGALPTTVVYLLLIAGILLWDRKRKQARE